MNKTAVSLHLHLSAKEVMVVPTEITILELLIWNQQKEVAAGESTKIEDDVQLRRLKVIKKNADNVRSRRNRLGSINDESAEVERGYGCLVAEGVWSKLRGLKRL